MVNTESPAGRASGELADLRRQLVQISRALSALGLLDARGRLSVRHGDRVTTTPLPGAGAPPPALLVEDDLVELALDGAPIAGRWPPPLDLAVDLALYRDRPAARAVVHAQPRTALAFAAAGRDLLPLTHTESALVHQSIPRIGDGSTIAKDGEAAKVVASLRGSPVALFTGADSLAVGGSPAEAAMLTQQLELLAQVNALALETASGGSPKVVERPDSDRIVAQRAPADDFLRYYADVAAHRPPGTEPPDAADASEAGLRRRIAAACRLLHHHGLVEHLEHVSVLVEDRSGFLITPRAHLGHLRPEEVAMVDMQGRWVAGPLEPPPFRHFHRDLFMARLDVRAIVHTHQHHARAHAVARLPLQPLYRGGAAELLGPQPIYDVPDLMFEAHHRAAAVAVLGSARLLHERAHGVDFLDKTVEAATVRAVQYEDQARVSLLAGRLGAPHPLDGQVIQRAAAEDPGPLDWWRHYLAELPRPSVTTYGEGDSDHREEESLAIPGT